MLKHEPKEADLLPMPSVAVLEQAGRQLKLLQPQIAAALRGPDISAAIGIVDRVLLEDVLGISSKKIMIFRRAREHLFQRRVTRGKGMNGPD
jgi:hypothetical protein